MDQAVKGIDLVLIGIGTGFTDLVEESLEGEVRQDVRAQGESIDVKADLILEIGMIPAGDGAAEDDVVLAGVALEQDIEQSGEGHE